ncbi:MAG TPA: AMP-binding protein, partial [Blastocatellia bacterium]|nr:AMP-binding protein [Blastocatellia bacterium]
MAGEPLKRELADQIFAATEAKVVCNLYGPSETTTYSTWVRMRRGEAFKAHIGRPISNTQIYILDEQLEPAPMWVAGEIYIGGAGVARGYFNRPELTGGRFLPDPFGGEPGARLYRTGDLGRWRPDGNIEFLGRNDHQVKIRGFRIELGEIEAVLSSHPKVREAVVIVNNDEVVGQRLIAYYTGTQVVEDVLRRRVSATLPEYMVPAVYIHLETLPLTSNGKLDRQALPAPGREAYPRRRYEPPAGKIEIGLARIWAEVLKVERVGRHDNFFELGGHSLLAVTLIERMRREGLPTTVRTLFTAPTLRVLAETMTGETVAEIEVPPNLIPPGCRAIRPEMLPLVRLTQSEIDTITAGVPGGAANIQDIYPLAPLQEGILFHHLMNAQGDAYLLLSLLAFETRKRLEEFIGAMQAVIARHDLLRTAVVWEGLSEPVQVVWREARLKIEEVTFDPIGEGMEDRGEVEIARQLRERYSPRHIRLNLGQAPLMRCIMTRDEANERWLLLWLSHHLTIDHTTIEVMAREAQALLLGEEERLPEPLPFRNFVAQARLGVDQEEHEAFFRAMLGEVEEPTAPFGLLDARGDGSGIEEERIELEASLGRRIRERARVLGVSAASLCHLAWAQVLARVSGREDVVFGTVLFGRMQGGEGIDRTVGLFINTLPVRIRVGAQGVEQSVKQTHRMLAELMRHEHASLALAQRCSGVAAPGPLFSALFNYRHNSTEALQLPEAARAWAGISPLDSEERTNYPLTLSVDDFGTDFTLTAHTVSPLDPGRICDLMRTALEKLVGALETLPETETRAIDVLPESERRQILVEWNATDAHYQPVKSGMAGSRREVCIHELFEMQVEQTPEAIALVHETGCLTYAELNARANQLAHYLCRLGIGPDARIAICMDRSIEMVVALLATLKAGGAYVPLDPAYPHERLVYMLEDSSSALMLTHHDVSPVAAGHSPAIPILNLERDAEQWAGQPRHNLDRAALGLSPRSLAYLIYTSGSTGLPKGVMVEHRGLCNLASVQIQAFAVDPGSRVLQFASFSFDACISEMAMTLCSGAKLVIPPGGSILAGETLLETIKRYGISHVTLPPAVLAALSEDAVLDPVQVLVVAGEAIAREQVQRWSPGRRMINAYGPTEVSVCAAQYECRGDEPGAIPIGCSINDIRLYILDTDH